MEGIWLLDLRVIRYFAAVAAEGSVTGAARVLGIQQAPLSQQIMALEAELGVQLFIRKPRGMALTHAGRVLFERSQTLLADVQAAADATRRAASGQTGTLRIGLTTSASLHPLPAHLIRAFRTAQPAVAIDLRQASTEGLLRRLADEALDIAFVRTVAAPPRSLRIMRLDREQMYAALPESHRLAPTANDREPLALKALASERFIAYPHGFGAGMYDAVVHACRKAGFEPRVEFSAPQIFGTLSLVAAGVGVTIVPRSLEIVKMKGVVFRPVKAHGLSAELNLAFVSTVNDGPAHAFHTVVRGHA